MFDDGQQHDGAIRTIFPELLHRIGGPVWPAHACEPNGVAIEINPYVVTLHEIGQKTNQLYEGCGLKNEVQRPCGKRF